MDGDDRRRDGTAPERRGHDRVARGPRARPCGCVEQARYPIQNAVLIALVLVLHPIAGSAGTLAAIPLSAVVAVALAAVVCAPVLAAGGGSSPALPDGAVRFGRLQAAGAALTQVTHRGGVVVVALLAGSAMETGYAGLAVGIAVGLTYAIVQIFTVSLPTVLTSSAEDPEEALTGIAKERARRHRARVCDRRPSARPTGARGVRHGLRGRVERVRSGSRARRLGPTHHARWRTSRRYASGPKSWR